MKSLKFYIFLLFTFIALSALGQEEKPRFLQIETGIDFISGDPPQKDYIRADVDQYYSDFVTTSLRGLLYKNYFSIKAEKKILNNKLGLLSGIRYTSMVSTLGRDDYWNESSDFFYLLFRQEDTKTEYLKVREIKQVTGYLGIPLEARIYPYQPGRFNVYYKIGADINYRLYSKTNAGFFNDEMEVFENELTKVVEEPLAFYSSFHLGVGFRLGPEEKPGVNFEILIPVTIITGRKGLVNPGAGAGLTLNARIPF
jgi:hypothetical protein